MPLHPAPTRWLPNACSGCRAPWTCPHRECRSRLDPRRIFVHANDSPRPRSILAPDGWQRLLRCAGFGMPDANGFGPYHPALRLPRSVSRLHLLDGSAFRRSSCHAPRVDDVVTPGFFLAKINCVLAADARRRNRGQCQSPRPARLGAATAVPQALRSMASYAVRPRCYRGSFVPKADARGLAVSAQHPRNFGVLRLNSSIIPRPSRRAARSFAALMKAFMRCRQEELKRRRETSTLRIPAAMAVRTYSRPSAGLRPVLHKVRARLLHVVAEIEIELNFGYGPRCIR